MNAVRSGTGVQGWLASLPIKVLIQSYQGIIFMTLFNLTHFLKDSSPNYEVCKKICIMKNDLDFNFLCMKIFINSFFPQFFQNEGYNFDIWILKSWRQKHSVLIIRTAISGKKITEMIKPRSNWWYSDCCQHLNVDCDRANPWVMNCHFWEVNYS